MPSVIDPETIHIDEFPGVWAPVQWEQTEEERASELEAQASAGLLANVDIPEAILRLLLNETAAELVFAPPEGYDPEEQGEWDETILTFAFRRPIRLEHTDYDLFLGRRIVEYNFHELGHWRFQIEAEKVVIERI